jgi:hypothetical protein
MKPSPMLYAVLYAVALAAALSSCTFVSQGPPPPRPQQTQLQVREYQTREFDTNDVRLVMKAVLNTLQDDGFVVKNAVVDLGLLTASKEIEIAQSGSRRTNERRDSDDYWFRVFESVFGSSGSASRNRQTNNQQPARFSKFKVIEVSVNVSDIGRRCKVRANFLAKVLDNQGDPMEVFTIDDQKFYQEFFAKVDKGVFLQRQGF